MRLAQCAHDITHNVKDGRRRTLASGVDFISLFASFVSCGVWAPLGLAAAAGVAADSASALRLGTRLAMAGHTTHDAGATNDETSKVDDVAGSSYSTVPCSMCVKVVKERGSQRTQGAD